MLPKKKWNRRLCFEQLDNRIALYSDMHPSLSVGTTPSLLREFGRPLETRSRSISTIVVLQSNSQRTLFFSLSHYPHSMEARPEGEARPESESNVLRFEAAPQVSQIISRIPNPVAIQTAPREFTPPSIAEAFGSNSVSSGSPGDAALHSIASPVPLIVTSSTIASSTLQLDFTSLITSNHETVLNPILQREKPTFAPALGQQSPLSSDTTARSDATAFTANGMHSFSMREANDRSNGLGRSRSPNKRNGSEYSRHLQMDLSKASDRTSEMVAYSNRLPAPNGMIEVRDNDVDRSERMKNKRVSKPGTNPFEILQWFVGSTNMVQTGNIRITLSSSSVPIGKDAEQGESAKLPTKQAFILALATGTLFVVAVRLNHLRYANQEKMSVSLVEEKQNSSMRSGFSLNPFDCVRRLVKQLVYRLS